MLKTKRVDSSPYFLKKGLSSFAHQIKGDLQVMIHWAKGLAASLWVIYFGVDSALPFSSPQSRSNFIMQLFRGGAKFCKNTNKGDA